MTEDLNNEQEKKKRRTKDDIADDLYAEFDQFIKKETELEEEVEDKLLIPTGIDILDAILGGGFAIGTLSVIVGHPGSGKSMLAMQVMGQGQRTYPGILCSYLDSENAVTVPRLHSLGVSRVKPRQDLTVEKVFQFLETVCVFKSQKKIMDKPAIVVWDSIANTLSQLDLETDIKDFGKNVAYAARIYSKAIPKYTAKMAVHNVALIAVNQFRDNIKINQYEKRAKGVSFIAYSINIPGGHSLRYNAFHLLEMEQKEVLKNYEFEGIKVAARCVKNKLFSPNIVVELIASFHHGFDNFWTNFEFLKQTKRIKTSGAWSELNGYTQKKFQRPSVKGMYESDEEFRKVYDEAVKEAIQTEIIDKYATDVPEDIEIEEEIEDTVADEGML